MFIERRFRLWGWLVVLSWCGCATTPPSTIHLEEDVTEGHVGPGKTAEKMERGHVVFPHSCEDKAAEHVVDGVVLLHHMTYHLARVQFQKATVEDPECAIAYWGVAATYHHPVWVDHMNEAERQAGLEALSKGVAAKHTSPRESGYLQALQNVFEQTGKREQIVAGESGYAKLHGDFPDDIEAKALHSIYLLSTVPLSDKSLVVQQRVAKVAEELLEVVPDHPAGHHYLIHACDNVKMAERALVVSRNYASIAPDNPHTWHMPGHIFTRLGLWIDSITWNSRSASAALKMIEHGGLMHWAHAIDYLSYAFLQRGLDDEIPSLISQMHGRTDYKLDAGISYALAATPVRNVLERHAWDEFSQIKSRQPSNYAWEKMPAWEAITYYGISLAAARAGKIDAAKTAHEKLDELRKRVSHKYWRSKADNMWRSAHAWILLAQGKKQKALKEMRASASADGKLDKHPVTPGDVYATHDLLGDMLMQLGKPKEALAAYEFTMGHSPNRFVSIAGAAAAAAKMGNPEVAKRYYRQLLDQVGPSSKRAELVEARKLLPKN